MEAVRAVHELQDQAVRNKSTRSGDHPCATTQKSKTWRRLAVQQCWMEAVQGSSLVCSVVASDTRFSAVSRNMTEPRECPI